ncbi:MAG: CBS domain-containing protein [Gammaproteobacteria bacterium]|nr:CBS domain-containing protein [Gammaproteobacteria bacterium]
MKQTVVFTDSIAFVAAFRELPGTARQWLAEQAQSLNLAPGETLFTAGQAFRQSLFVIHSGQVELQRPGKPSLILQPGDALGVSNYFEGAPYISTAVAVGDAEIIVLPDAALRALESTNLELTDALNRLMSECLRSQAAQPVAGLWALPARSIMKSPLTTCDAGTTVQMAFDLMNRRRIGSLGVIDDNGRLIGLVTFVTLARGLLSKQAKADQGVLGSICEPAHSIGVDAPLWKVQSEQARLGAKYLVVEQDDRPLGIISQTDVLYALLTYQQAVIAQIGDAGSFSELELVSRGLGRLAHELRESNRSAGMAVRALSEVHLAMQRRCIELVLEELCREGRGEPPVSFAFLIMGSGGRKEMMIRTDQDNGIILADERTTDEPATRAWFMEFCDRVNHRLDALGYEWCTGDIMARNPDFHKSLSEWRRQISYITEIPNAKRARWSTIFFDFETLYGDDRLTVALRNHLFEELRRKPRLLRSMVEDDASGGPALGLFNRLVPASDGERKGKIDLKRNGTRILVDAARIYALSVGISVTNTGDRLAALVRQGRLDNILVDSILAAYDELLDLTLAHQLRQLRGKEPLDKLLDPEELTPLEEESLRMAMRVIKRLQSRLQGEFGTTLL